MDIIKMNHLDVFRAQSAVLKEELRKQSHLSSGSSVQDLSPLLKKRLPPNCSADDMRRVDNFEMTLMYVLDKDGLIREKHRLGEWPVSF